ncbi:pyruvate kinase [Allohahella sp. A8]|uniref:pyruvate kinase n=1 Tax=Allohahella sp. A8 TaxID=3141461 RepID=UPI003A810FB6
MRRTKILATLGPATDSETTLENLLLAGANVVRLNFSHGSAQDHVKRAELVRHCAEKHQLNVAILVDLQGPKIRIGRFENDSVKLQEGDKFVLDASDESIKGNEHGVSIAYPELPRDCKPGDILMLDDGRIQLRVESVDGLKLHCQVRVGGKLSNNKGINKQGGGLSAPALTDKDRADIKTASEIEADYVAVSFPKTGDDIREARQLLEDAGSSAAIVAKIERAEAVIHSTLDDIIEASDAVMVARGDLGVEIGDAELVGTQKHIIRRANDLNRLVIVATQMMESMITSTMPTRAEVFDVANSVLDGADAVMLSAETATGEYPVEVVRAMSRICVGAEKNPMSQLTDHRMSRKFQRTDEMIAMATMYTANHLGSVKAIICLTESGDTPKWMSRISSSLPIYGLTRRKATQRKMALFKGVQALYFDSTSMESGQVNEAAIDFLKQRGAICSGDRVIYTKGTHMGLHGATNALMILQVP